MSALGVILLVVGGLVLLGVVAIAAIAAVGVRLRGVEARVRARLAPGERFVLEPAVGNYRGATGRFGIVKGAAIIAVTDHRVLCHKAFGAPIEIPLAEITGVREDRWFLRAANDLTHLILRLRDGVEVGVQVRAPLHAQWLETLRATLGATAAR